MANEWYVFSMSDNDFITQNGYLEVGSGPPIRRRLLSCRATVSGTTGSPSSRQEQ